MNVLTIDRDNMDYLGVTLVLAAIVVSTLCYVYVLLHAGIVFAE
jgi:hypothetical protein